MFQKIQNSLIARITFVSLLMALFTLCLAGGAIAFMFEQSLEHALEAHLVAYSDLLIGNINIDNGKVVLRPETEMLQHIPRYWQVSSGGKNLYKSDNLQSWIMPKPESLQTPQWLDAAGNDGNMIVAVQNTYRFPGDINVTLISGLDNTVAEAYKIQEKARLQAPLFKVFAALVVLLVISSLLTTRFAIAPIKEIKKALQSVKSGKTQRIEGAYPYEIEILIIEMNQLLDHTSDTVKRHKDFAANLSHSLKTPLTVIKNETGSTLIKSKVDVMMHIIERNLTRSNIATTPPILFAASEILPMLQEISEGFGKVYAKNVEIDYPAHWLFKGDKADLYEIVGNIIENACKFARTRIKISHSATDIIIEDDGEGIPEMQRTHVLQRGTRLDETKAGTGIGLTVARDIIALYKGNIRLESSGLSGLKVILTLPVQR